MTQDFPHRAELLELLEQLRNGELTAAQVAQIEEIVCSDDRAAALYIDYVHMDVALRYSVGKPSAHSPASFMGIADAPEEAISVPEAPESAVPSSTGPVKSPVLGFLGGVVDYIGQSRTLMFWLIAVGLVGYFAVHFGAIMLGRFWQQNAPQVAEDREEGAEKHGQPGAAEGKIVARLTITVDDQWEVAGASAPGSRQSLPLGAEFHAGQKLNLTAGLAELTFDSGAKVILHAPVQFTVGEALGGNLQVGRLTAKVPHSAAGFTINTPGGKVVDLGTEFGVKVNEDRTMHVIVYVGEVMVDSGPGAAGDPKNTVHVKAGEAVVMAPGQPAKSTPAQEEQFIRDLAPLGNKAEVEAAYVEFVKKLKPAVWFRMEGNDADRVVHDEVKATRDGELHWDGAGNPFVKGRIGKGLWLRGAKLGDHVYVPDYPTAAHAKLTVSAWAYAETRHKDATIAANWRENSAAGQFQFALFSNATPDTANLGVGITGDDGRALFLGEGQTHPFPLYEWQHVAFSTDGSTLRLYRQGREVASLQHSGLKYPSPIASLGVGVTFDSSDRRPSTAPSCWDGKLDEVMIFNDTLSAEQIQKLAAAAPR